MTSQRLMCRVVALLGIGVCLFATPALAQDCPELVGRLPGRPITAVAVSGDYAYLGGDSGLYIADVSAPSAPRIVGEVGQGGARGLEIAGGYAYVVVDYPNSGLHVIDVSAPSAPVEVGFIDTPSGASGVAVAGSHAYVVVDYPNSGLHVIDVSAPSAPVEVGFVATPGWPKDVAVSGDYAYVPAGDSYLAVIDVSTPSAPVVVRYFDPLGAQYATDVDVSGGYAYVADSEGFRVLDISNPSAPVEVGFVDMPVLSVDVAVMGGYVYLLADGALRVIDVRIPSAPVEVGLVDTPGHAADVAVSGSHAYISDVYEGLQVMDVSTPSAPTEVGSVVTWFPPSLAVAATGGYAYVASEWPGLHVIDVSAPSTPVEVGFVHGGWGGGPSGADISVVGGYAYVTAARCYPYLCSSYFSVFDVSTPSAPVEVGFASMTGIASSIAVAGSYAYVAWGDRHSDEGGLRVIDVSTPSAPIDVGFVAIAGRPHGVAVSDGYAYVTWVNWDFDEGGLRVIDVSTPSAPVEVGFIDTPSGASRVAVAGSYAYVGGDGISVIDVSTPSAPVEVGSVDTPGYVYDVAVTDDFVYVTVGDWLVGFYGYEGNRSLRVIDVSSPSAPVEVGFHEALPTASGEGGLGDVAVADGYVYFAANHAGLYVFNECAPLADASECFIPAAAVAAGAQGAFFQTDVEVNNTGAEEAEVHFQWLPRGQDNSQPAESEPIALAAGQSLRWENVLTELFNLEPDSLGALKLVANTESVIGMSRTYNVPGAKAAGTFGQGLPAIRATEMIKRTQPRRIIFLSEDFSSRANVGCVNGSSEPVTINVELFSSQGESLEVKTMDLGPWSNDQINHVFQGHLMGNGYVDVWADRVAALYYCYGSMLDNSTSDPTTILPQVPSADMTFIPAAALAAGLEGSFFQTDVDLNNVGSTDITYELLWLPRGEDNSDPVSSDTFSLAPGAGARYANVLDEVFGLEPDQVGALAVEASGTELLAMSRTYNLPSAKVAGTFGQELPGIPADRMIPTGVTKRIIFMSENDDVRANVGCVNGAGIETAVAIDLYGSDGALLETKYMMLPPYSNRQINGIFQDYAPINGYVDVRTYTPDASIYCYGSVLDNVTSDPTTVLPQ